MLRFIYRLSDALRQRARRGKSTHDQAQGRRGEDLAHRFLQRSGMVIVARNYRRASGAGEVDLVAWDQGVLVFVEVKARASDAYGAPDRAVGPDKQLSVIRTAREFTSKAHLSWDLVRFDVVSIVLGVKPEIEHFRNAFRPARSFPSGYTGRGV